MADVEVLVALLAVGRWAKMSPPCVWASDELMVRIASEKSEAVTDLEDVTQHCA